MPLPLIVSCFSEIQIGFTFLVPAHPDSPGKGPLNECVCVCSKGNTFCCEWTVERMLWCCLFSCVMWYELVLCDCFSFQASQVSEYHDRKPWKIGSENITKIIAVTLLVKLHSLLHGCHVIKQSALFFRVCRLFHFPQRCLCSRYIQLFRNIDCCKAVTVLVATTALVVQYFIPVLCEVVFQQRLLE